MIKRFVFLRVVAVILNTTVVANDAWGEIQNLNLIGTEYDGGLDIPGWENEGGGLMSEPVWYHHYTRSDDAQLVLIEWALPRKPGATLTPFRITDVLVIPRVEKGLGLTFDCEPPRTNVFEKVFAVVRIDIRQKWWRDVRKAWKVETRHRHDLACSDQRRCLSE